MPGHGGGEDKHGGGAPKVLMWIGIILVAIFALRGLGVSLGVNAQFGSNHVGFAVGGHHDGFLSEEQRDELRDIYK